VTIISNPVTGPVLGQPIHPNFSQQFAGTPPANTIVAPVPLAAGIGGTQKTMLEMVARGEMPRNAMVTAVNGVSTGAQNPTPVDDCMSNGCGAQLNLGVAVAGTAGNPVSNGAINQQIFSDGYSGAAQTGNGAVPKNTETLTSCPVSGATTGANITLNGSYQG
jgi:hypothetical protein